MKRNLFFLLPFLFSFLFAQAQWTTTGSDIYYNAGNVGIGTSTPNAARLDVQSVSGSSGGHTTIYGYSEHTASTTNTVMGIYGVSKGTHSTGNITYAIGVSGNSFNSGSGTITAVRAVQGTGILSGSGNITSASAFYGNITVTGSGTVTDGYGLYIGDFSASGITNKWGVYVNDATAKNYFAGNVGIGTTATGSFKLAVEGKIGAREVKVTLENPWPDYVFDKKYPLLDIATLERYITINKHLPGIPSAKEIKENGGIELGQMSAKLLEKIEELTLYVIQLKKEIDEIKLKELPNK